MARKRISHLAKLTAQQVRQIRNAAGKGVTLKELARKFNVSTTCISFVVRRITYKGVK